MVKQFYGEVAHLPHITDHAIGTIMQQLSIHNEFDTIAALKELYIYVTKYRDQVKIQINHHHNLYSKIICNILFLLHTQILDALNNDSNCIKGHLAQKLENVACTLEGEEASACWQEQHESRQHRQSSSPTVQNLNQLQSNKQQKRRLQEHQQLTVLQQYIANHEENANFFANQAEMDDTCETNAKINENYELNNGNDRIDDDDDADAADADDDYSSDDVAIDDIYIKKQLILATKK